MNSDDHATVSCGVGAGANSNPHVQATGRGEVGAFLFAKPVWLAGWSLFLSARLVLAQPAGNPAPVHDVDGSFIREWLVLGPFPTKDMETDFLAEAGGEANVRPKEGDTVATKDGTRLTWTRFRSKSDMVNLEQVVGLPDFSVAYAYCELNSERSMETDLRAYSYDRGFIWLNGKPIGQTSTSIGMIIDVPPVLPIQLNQGPNPCLLKFKMQIAVWHFLFQPLPYERAPAEIHAADPSGMPMAGALVQFYDQGELVGRVNTDQSGAAQACLFPPAAVYDLRITSGETGTWRYDVVFPPGGRRSLDVSLSNAVSISGQVLAMDRSPQNAIVVQALFENVVTQADQPGTSPAASRLGGKEPGEPATRKAGGLPTPAAPDRQSGPAGGAARPLRPAEGAAIKPLLPLPAFSETVLTDTNGNFRFVNLRPGHYRLRCHGPDGFIYPEAAQGTNAPELALIAVEPGRAHEGVTFRFPEAKKGVWKRFPINAGLQETGANFVRRTPDGKLWLGTEGQLQIFDGVEFKVFQSPEIPGDQVLAIEPAADGSVWIGTSGGLGRFVAGEIQTPALNNRLPRKRVTSIQTASDGTVWFGTYSGLWRYHGRGFDSFTVNEGLPSNTIDGLLKSADGTLWVSTLNGLARYDGQRFSVLEPFHGFSSRRTGPKLHQSKDGAIWSSGVLGQPAGAIRYDGRAYTQLTTQNGLLSDVVWDIAETSDGAIWFASPGGLSKFNGTTVLNYTGTVELSAGGNLQGICADSDDVLWCATDHGILRFDPNGFVRVTNRDGLSRIGGGTPAVFALEPDRSGGFWVGTGWGGVYRTDRKRFHHVESSLPAGLYVRAIHTAADGTVWCATDKGIFKIENDRLVRVLGERNWVSALTRDSDGSLWYGQSWFGGGLTRYDPKTGAETFFTTAQGLPDNQVSAVEPCSDGGVWVGTGAGLARCRDGKIEDFREPLGIRTGAVSSLRRDADDTLWIASDLGLHRLERIPKGTLANPLLNGFRRVSITASNGLPNQHIWCSARTADGIIWMGTDRNGLLGYDGKAVTVLDKRDGLSGNTVLALAADKDNSLWLGFGEGGLTRYRPAKTPPSVRLVEVRLAGQTLADYSNPPPIVTGNQVAVQYQEIDLKTHPDKRQFWYRVEGPAGETLYAAVTKERRFEWTPRKGGAYTFEVQAIDRDLNYSQPARFAFRARVPWYANAWILAPASSTFGGLAIWAFVVRALYLRKSREAGRLREQMLVQERQARERLEEKTRQLEKAKEEADTANRAKSAFLANMSHEIRTPLNAIMGYAQILRRTPGLAANERAAVKTIEASGDHLLTLINSVLDLSKIEAGSMELQPVDFDLTQLIQEVAAMFRIRCEEKGLEWRVEFECGMRSAERGAPADNELPAENTMDLARNPIFVRGDEGKLCQILINLLGNAVKFTGSGHVTLRLVRRDNPEPSTFTFEIIDSGPGIPAGAQEKLFAPFVQVGEGVKRGGTGLGLAISRRLVELMGGTIGLRSAAREGSNFYFTIPLAPASEGADSSALPELSEPTHLAAGSKVHALIVDDLEQNREVLRQILASLGCQVRLAENGERALELIRLEIPDIVITDIRMPGMGGLELKNKIVNEFGSGRMHIVAISASVLAHQQKGYLESGFDDFIAKPFRVARIAECLARLLPVEFEYEPQPEALSASQTSDLAGRERIILPEALLSRLRTSAKSYRILEFKRCLVEVEQQGAEGRRLAAALEVLNQKGEMEKILEILDKLA